MATPNYSFAKKQRELAKKQKKEAKLQRKQTTPDEPQGESSDRPASNTQRDQN